MDTAETAGLLSAHFSAWAHLTKEEQDGMLSDTVLTRYAKGACIHNGENDCKGMLLIKKGQLRTYMLSESGKEITLYRLGAGDVCVLSASCVLSAITFEVQIDAEEDSEVLFISPLYLQSLMERNIHVECFVYKTATDRFSDVMWAMQQILFMSMDKRLAVFLWDEIAKTADDTVHLTHEQVARDVGSAREVVSRMLKYFSSEGIVELSRGGIRIINKQKLRKLAE
ncbi:CRP/FNR family transcriptional regulator, anaerobic regulatory protein [Sporobacter termitidis DSM 10068]|uniref:CRP/FNR family transcriptional regulator, anaerobic regulatory protein n=1 Tax=Sporobacter termitidis DSM 10068 TaxID=1123282 RepID=A0A1M5WA16_9FIRM|nr:Crp/Fnr family transcriptional regulator [Sporobacter termitidis]SHH84278.1 CRP/FNR family transcriptional regulator, anaerobic regulatory protein [Sporobacter termitidis DSM 10068]